MSRRTWKFILVQLSYSASFLIPLLVLMVAGNSIFHLTIGEGLLYESSTVQGVSMLAVGCFPFIWCLGLAAQNSLTRKQIMTANYWVTVINALLIQIVFTMWSRVSAPLHLGFVSALPQALGIVPTTFGQQVLFLTVQLTVLVLIGLTGNLLMVASSIHRFKFMNVFAVLLVTMIFGTGGGEILANFPHLLTLHLSLAVLQLVFGALLIAVVLYLQGHFKQMRLDAKM